MKTAWKVAMLAVVMVGAQGCLGGDDGGDEGGGGTGGGEHTAGLSCKQMIDCYSTCDDAACTDACDARGSTDGQRKMAAIDACATNHGCQDRACVEQKCAAEMEQCGVNPDGGKTCVQIFACIETCEDQDCADVCVGAGSDEAQTQYGNLIGCGQDHGCTEDTCYDENCMDEINACVGEDAG